MRLPDALGEPRAEGPLAEDRVNAVGEGADLTDAIAPRDPHQNRLVVTAREELDLPAPDQVGEVADHVRAVTLQPVEQWPGEVETRLHFGMAIERRHERGVRTLGHLLED